MLTKIDEFTVPKVCPVDLMIDDVKRVAGTSGMYVIVDTSFGPYLFDRKLGKMIPLTDVTEPRYSNYYSVTGKIGRTRSRIRYYMVRRHLDLLVYDLHYFVMDLMSLTVECVPFSIDPSFEAYHRGYDCAIFDSSIVLADEKVIIRYDMQRKTIEKRTHVYDIGKPESYVLDAVDGVFVLNLGVQSTDDTRFGLSLLDADLNLVRAWDLELDPGKLQWMKWVYGHGVLVGIHRYLNQPFLVFYVYADGVNHWMVNWDRNWMLRDAVIFKGVLVLGLIERTEDNNFGDSYCILFYDLDRKEVVKKIEGEMDDALVRIRLCLTWLDDPLKYDALVIVEGNKITLWR